MSARLRVYGFKKGWQGIMEMNVAKEGKSFIGGIMEFSQMAEGLHVVYNADGFIRCLEPRVLFWEGKEKEVDLSEPRYFAYGNCFVCRVDGNGNFTSIKDGDVEIIRHHLKAVASVSNGIIHLE